MNTEHKNHLKHLEGCEPGGSPNAGMAADRAEQKLGHLPFAIGLARHARLLIRFVRACAGGGYRASPWALATAGSALLYLVTTADAVPDLVPGAGLLDDAAVLAAAVAVLGRELARFAAWERGQE